MKLNHNWNSADRNFFYFKCVGFSEVVTDRGNIKIGSVKGNLQVATKTGNIDTFIAEHENVELITDKGDVTRDDF